MKRRWRGRVGDAVSGVLVILLTSCGSPASDPVDSTFQQEAWGQFLRNDPEWPASRETWLQGTPADRRRLLEALYVALIRGAPAEDQEAAVWSRAHRELILLGSECIPFLIQMLEIAVDQERREWVAIDRTGLALADLYAVEELAALVDAPGSSTELAFAAVLALAQVRDAEVVPHLLHFGSHADWRIREKCVQGLARHLPEEQARSFLIKALRDPDPLVREKAAFALGSVRSPEVQDVLVERYEEALRADDRRQWEALHEALCRSAGRVLKPCPASEWRRLLAEQRMLAEQR